MNTHTEINTLVRSCMPMVRVIASKFWGPGVEYEDLVGAGNEGLVKAAQLFDRKRGHKFTTYSSYWIRAYMYIVIERAQSGRLSVAERKIFYGSKRVRKELGIDATEEQIAEYLGVDASAATTLQARRSVSLNKPIDGSHQGSGKKTLQDTITDNSETAEEKFAHVEESHVKKQMLRRAMDRLGPKEHAVISARFLSGKHKTLQEIGDAMGISRERVRQIEERALRQLSLTIREAGGL